MRYCEKCGKPLEDDEICSCEVETVEEAKIVVDDPRKGMWKVILTAIIYPPSFTSITITYIIF